MTFVDACLYSLTGMLVVFFALVLLMGIIKLMTAIGDRAEKKASRAVPQPAGAIPAPDAHAPAQSLRVTGPEAPGAAGDIKLYDTDPRTAAMLMAIVADTMQAPLNELRFISIKEIKE